MEDIEALRDRLCEYIVSPKNKKPRVVICQDDVLLTAITLAGYSWGDADKLRKAVGKKIPAEMKKQEEKFIEKNYLMI